MKVERLHLGCFDRVVPGWTNTDVTPHLFVARVPGLATLLQRMGKMSERRLTQHRAGVFRKVRYLNLGRKFPIASDSVEAVFSCHVLEHLPPAVASRCLDESFRVLRPGGVIRIGVPDLELWMDRFDRSNPDDFVAGVFETLQNGGKNRHYWMYTDVSLIRLLGEKGFVGAARRAFREGSCPDIALLDNRESETLFVEAFKPQ